METRTSSRVYLSSIFAGAIVLGLLYLARISSYLLFHSLAELFTITVAACIFMMVWNSRRLIENQYLLFLGIASLFIAAIDLLHLLTYPGMSVFAGLSSDVPTQFWILGRSMQAAALFIAPSLFGHKTDTRVWTTVWAAIAVAMTALILGTDLFPSCLGPNGLTTFKIAAELVISAVLLASLFRLRSHSARFRPSVLRALSWSVGVTIMSELVFILYADPYGPLNLLGHLLRILATYLLYKGIIETALVEPHSVLFRELSASNEALRESDLVIRKAMALSKAMNGIDAAVNSTLDLDTILSRALLGSAEALDADSAAISYRDGAGWVVRHVYGLSEESVGSRLEAPEARHLFAAAEGRMPLIIADVMNDERVDPGLMSRLGITSLLTVPLTAAGDVVGVITFHMRSAAKAFDVGGRDFAARLAVSLALAIENARLYTLQREIADTLQNAMLFFPDELPGVSLGHAYRSADELALIGGDFYAAFELGDGRIGLVLGDVAGKGIAAATASSIARTTMHALSVSEARPADVLAAANRVLFRLLPEGVFATATYATVDVKTGVVVLCSAGHPDPFVCTFNGCLRHDARRNRPLGIWEDTTYEEFSITLNPGDSIVLFSDGLPDARRGKEFFGEERIGAVLDRLRDAAPQFIVDTLMADATEFSGDRHTDDIAIIAATIHHA